MNDLHIAITATVSIILFVFGLENFSKEIQSLTGAKFRKFIGRATQYSSVGVVIGAVVTAIVQSSSATSVIAISLVNAGVLSFKSSVGIIFGSNIGTTVTAQLVAFKLTSFAPVLIILGFALSFIRSKYTVFSKSLFYFGFVFFSLNMISAAIEPLKNDPRLFAILTQPQGPLWGILVGCIITAVIQSSSVTTGLAVVFVQQGLLSMENAVPILMGANIGTTATALISIVNMDIAAKKTALAHFLFNFGGVVLFLPIIYYFGVDLPFMSSDPTIALANFHLLFNVSVSVAFIIALKPFTALIDKLLGEGKMDFKRINFQSFSWDLGYEKVESELLKNNWILLGFLQENYNLVTLSIETNFKGVYETSKKRIEYIEYFKSEMETFFAEAAAKLTNEVEIESLLRVMGLYEYTFQIHDSIKDLAKTKENMDANYVELKSDLLLLVRELSSGTLSLFAEIGKDSGSSESAASIREHASDLQDEINNFNRDILKLMTLPERNDAGALMHLVTYNQRLKDKLVNFYSLWDDFRSLKREE